MGTVVREHVHPTSQSVVDNDIPFLELTICPEYEYAYKEDLLNSYGMNKRKYRSGTFFSLRNQATGQDLRAIFNSITYDVDEILHKIKFYTKKRLNPSNSKTFATINFEYSNFTKHIDVTTKYSRTLGRCFGIRPKEHILKLGVTKISITARIDIYVYFGYPGQFTYTNTKSKVSKY